MPSFARPLLTAALSLAVALPLLAFDVPSEAAAAITNPRVPVTLPAGIEADQPYVPQDSCDPVEQRGTAALAKLLVSTYPGTSIIGTAYQCGTDGPVSEHYEGRAIDWAVWYRNPYQVAQVGALFKWLFASDRAGHHAAMARRLGIMYIIWNQRIIGSWNDFTAWQPYSCTGVTGCHQNHVHLSLSWAGARGLTSFWTGRVAPVDYGPCRVAGLALAPPRTTVNPAACPALSWRWPAVTRAPSWLAAARKWSGAYLRRGSSGPAVSALQAAVGVSADGSFGPITAAALGAFQRAHRLPVTAASDAATWRALLARA